MDKKSKNGIGQETTNGSSLTKGDELLYKLLKVRMPMVPDPEPATPCGDSLLDDIDQMLLNHPGLTREEVEEMIKEYGF